MTDDHWWTAVLVFGGVCIITIIAFGVWAIHHNDQWDKRCRAMGGHPTNEVHAICLRDGRVLEP
jgi:hypothetical protein